MKTFQAKVLISLTLGLGFQPNPRTRASRSSLPAAQTAGKRRQGPSLVLTTKELEMMLASETWFSESPEDSGGSSCSGPHGDPTPLKALKRIVRSSFERERCSSTDRQDLNGRSTPDPSAFEMLSSEVRAAQCAGELRAGDAAIMATLIISAVLGAAELSPVFKPTVTRGRATGTVLPSSSSICSPRKQ